MTDYATATRGFDPEFKDELIAKITAAIATASMVSDAPIMAIRTGETIEALISCLISVASMSSYFDQPSHLLEFTDTLSKRVRRSVANIRANPPEGTELYCGLPSEGTA